MNSNLATNFQAWTWETVQTNDGSALRDIVVTLDKDLPSLTVGKRNGEIEDAKSALYAASDFLRHRRYSVIEPGLHLNKAVDLNAAFASNVGVVHVNYAGSAWPKPDKRVAPMGWAQINIRNGMAYLVRFSETSDGPRLDQNEMTIRSRKHDWIDIIAQGNNLIIQVSGFNHQKNLDGVGAADYVLSSWEEKDDAKALALRNEGWRNAQNKSRVRREVRRFERRYGASEDAVSDAEASGELNLMLAFAIGEPIHLHDLPFQVLKFSVPSGRKNLQTVVWDGSVNAQLYIASWIDQGAVFQPVKK